MVIDSRYNAFESACLEGNLQKVQDLAPADLNYRIDYQVSMDGETPLILAIKSKQIDVVSYLLKKGADPQLTSEVGPLDYIKWHEGIQNVAPLYVAASQKNPEIADLLISYGVEINFLTPLSGSPLQIATQVNDLPLVRLLLGYGADPNLYRPSIGLSEIPLFWAAFQCQLDTLQVLIQYGADINAKNTDGETALFWTFSDSGHFKIVQELVEHGIEVNARNRHGKTALSLALRHKSWTIVEFLRSHGAVE